MSVIFDFIKEVLAFPLGLILKVLYALTNNYVIAIILLTALVKLCFLPGTIRQHKAQVKNKVNNEKIKLIKTKYADDPETLKKEVAALKSQNNKKLNIGCLSTIVHFIVIIGLFGVIYTPLTSVIGIEKNTVAQMETVMEAAIEESDLGSSMLEITLLTEADKYRDELITGNILSPDQLDKIAKLKAKYNLFGIDLGRAPSLKQFNELWIIPSLVFISAALLPIHGQIKLRKENPTYKKFTAIEALPFIPPMLMFLFAFLFSAGVGLYWAVSNLLSFVQTIVLNIIYNPTKENLFVEALAETKDVPEENDVNLPEATE